VEYTNEGSRLFAQMNDDIVLESVAFLFHFEIRVLSAEEQEQQRKAQEEQAKMQYSAPDENGSSGSEQANGNAPKKQKESKPKAAKKTNADGKEYKGVKPNDPCPCGSGKKYKMCHGKNAEKGHSTPKKKNKSRKK
jgi:preprotein translocase subunit SecA